MYQPIWLCLFLFWMAFSVAKVIHFDNDMSWSDMKNACIRGNNYKVYESVTIDTCKAKCIEEDDINCQSIEYSVDQQMCCTSEARSDSDDYAEPCFVDGWEFAEIEIDTDDDCTDKSDESDCEYWAGEGYCEVGYVEFMTENCTKSCNKCGPTTSVPTTTTPSNTNINFVSCNLAWNYGEERPLIMIRETHIIIPQIDKDISDDPNRIPEGIPLIFACAGDNNEFRHIDGKHSKLHGECVSTDQIKVCVNYQPVILDLSQLSCTSKIHPTIIQKDNHNSYKDDCENTGGELYRIGYRYGDYKELKELDTKVCINEKDQKTLWSSTNDSRIEISPSVHYKDPSNLTAAQGFANKALYAPKAQREPLQEAVWNGMYCHNHGGQCVRGGDPCPEHLRHQMPQGHPFCNSFYKCCYAASPLPVQVVRKFYDCKVENECKCRAKTTGCNVYERPLAALLDCNCKRGGLCCINPKYGYCIEKYWEKDSGKEEKSPLILQKKDSKLVIVLPDKLVGKKRNIGVEDKATLVITCGEDNRFESEDIKTKTIEVVCDKGKFRETDLNKRIKIMDLGCKKFIKDSAEFHKLGESKVKCKEDEPDWFKCKIGFKLECGFFPLIEVCFDEKTKTTVWTKHDIHGENLKSHSNRIRRDFADKEKFFGDINLKALYTKKAQWKINKDRLNDRNYINKERRYVEKGHLAPVADFVLSAEMLATNHYINAVPMWKDINQGNWQAIETEIRIYAEKEAKTLTITTGTYEILRAAKIPTGVIPPGDERIFLTDTNKVPVPEILWKVVEHGSDAVVFVVINDPFTAETDSTWEPCEDKCDKIKFLNTKFEFDNFNERLRHDRCFGYTWCCQLTDALRVKIPTIPVTGNKNLLDENKGIEIEK